MGGTHSGVCAAGEATPTRGKRREKEAAEQPAVAGVEFVGQLAEHQQSMRVTRYGATGLSHLLWCLPHLQELQALPPPLTQTPADSVAAAVGVELNRLQNICISLDKAKHCLNQPGQCRDPPLAVMTDEEVAEYLWEGDKSVAKRAVKAAAAQILEKEVPTNELYRKHTSLSAEKSRKWRFSLPRNESPHRNTKKCPKCHLI